MIIKALELTKTYGGEESTIKALDAASVAVQEGEFVAVMGPSGSGKSTLLHLMGGLDRPTSGRVVLGGADITVLNEDELALVRRERIGFIFQAYNLVQVLTAKENVGLPLLLDGRKNAEIEERASRAIGLVGLGSRRDNRPSQLSGGEQQRVAIARALVNNPQIILADEPTGNLDSLTAEEIMALLKRLQKENGQTIVMVTHDSKMAAYAERIIFLKDGRVIDDESLGSQINHKNLLAKLKGGSE